MDELPIVLELDGELTENQKELKDRIMEHLKEAKQCQKLPPLKMVNKRQLIQILKDVNRAIHEIKDKTKTRTRTETNQLMYSTASIITQELGYKIETPIREKEQKALPWKIGLERKVAKLRADVSRLEEMKKENSQEQEDKGCPH